MTYYKSDELIEELKQIKGAYIFIQPDKNSMESENIYFESIKYYIANLHYFEATCPKFFAQMIENSKMRQSIKSFNKNGEFFCIGRSVQIDSKINDEIEFNKDILKNNFCCSL